MNDIAPGWYKDPAEPSTQRYWDGEGWIGESLPIDATPPSTPPKVAPAGPVTLPPAPTTGEAPAPTSGTPGPWLPGGQAPGGQAPGGQAPGGQAPGGEPPAGAGTPEAGQAPGPQIGASPTAPGWPQSPPGWPQVPPPVGPPPTAGMPLPPGTAVPPPGVPVPPGSPAGGWPPGAPPNLPPGVPPGSIPWPAGAPIPPGYRVAYGYAPAEPRPHGLPIAHLGLRFLARLIDFGVVLGLSAVATGWLVYLLISDYLPLFRAVEHSADYSNLPAVSGRATALTYLIPVIWMVIWLVYEVPAVGRTGQSFGKRVVGIRVMPLESDASLGFARALRRWSPLGVPLLLWTCGLGLILQLVDSISPAMGGPLQLALHDRSAQTVVVRVGRRGHEITPLKAQKKPGEQS
ncbi:RDD family protein [Rugosimonospora africana]|uniref:RDD family protein n=1 Tax=Rugosimonospora africana TaxID=556532 RepID=A0A8J3R295_9ACTN|nr:RDD family protein [Rugosimonospora africana]GIH21138.1 hypothetical protein Raf01_93100 [Rugosimonospora africana]